jgi:hypothetical protein
VILFVLGYGARDNANINNKEKILSKPFEKGQRR